MVSRIGFMINPIAGMGGRVGLKGTDDVVDAAIELGAVPSAQLRAGQALAAFKRLSDARDGGVAVEWLTCTGTMGASCLEAAGLAGFRIVCRVPAETSANDTERAAHAFLAAGVDVILFCGGDGTARDLCRIVGKEIPLLGIPAGVKMYSGVFGVTPERTAEILLGFVEGRLQATLVDILDLDERKYRQGEWAVRLYHSALTPYEPALTQAAKMLVTETGDTQVKQEIADYLREDIQTNPETLYLLGPGSTVQSVGLALGADKTLLGVDAVAACKTVGRDLNERDIATLMESYPRTKLILSPIGAQGFVLGRGNLQLSPDIIGRIGADAIVIVATPAKLQRTPVLRFDTGDTALDAILTADGYLPVVIGYRLRRLVKVQA